MLHDHDGREMERLGQKTADGEHCAWGEHTLPIGMERGESPAR